MDRLLSFILVNEVVVGMIGTIVVVLAVLVGYGRRHEAAMKRRTDQERAAPPGLRRSRSID